MNTKKLVLETGEVFEGVGFGADTEKVAELVYNTAVVGYQEALSDPSNLEYIMVMGYPVIGSYGFLLPHKGNKEVIEAVNIIKKDIPDIYPDEKLMFITTYGLRRF